MINNCYLHDTELLSSDISSSDLSGIAPVYSPYQNTQYLSGVKNNLGQLSNDNIQLSTQKDNDHNLFKKIFVGALGVGIAFLGYFGLKKCGVKIPKIFSSSKLKMPKCFKNLGTKISTAYKSLVGKFSGFFKKTPKTPTPPTT